MELRDRHVLVIGYGVSGASVVQFCLQRGARVSVADLRGLSEMGETAQAHAKRDVRFLPDTASHHDPLAYDLAVLSPGVPQEIDLVARLKEGSVEVVGEVEFAWRFLTKPVVGITGTNGKSTTTALIGHLLATAGREVFVGGNLGTPLIEGVAEDERWDAYIVELSSFQLETIDTFRPHIGVLLNITPDHLNRYPDFDAYVRAKRRLFENQRPGDWAVLNAADELVAETASSVVSQVREFDPHGGLPYGVAREGDEIIYTENEHTVRFALRECALVGDHNVENMMAAMWTALLLDVEPETIVKGLRTFKGLEHRLEFVAEIGGVRYYNDSKATNVDAAIRSLTSFEEEIVWIAGGSDKGTDFQPLKTAINGRLKTAILIGESAEAIQGALGEGASIVRAEDMFEAVDKARDLTKSGDVVLLAPACASFDQFRNFEHRGEVFKRAVLEKNAEES